jgi:heat shock protein HtpX
MEYIGIKTQQSRNNWRSAALLVVFPLLVVALTFVLVFIFSFFSERETFEYLGEPMLPTMWNASKVMFVNALPWVVGGVALWFFIAFLFNTQIINRATHSRPLERSENKRVYNLVENLTMASGMKMPRVNVIESDALNAFASGINDKTYTVTLTTGIIDTLSDEELEGVIAHELTHIRNRDVRVLIVSIVFVGIFSLIMSGAFNAMPYVRGKNSGPVRLALLVVGLVAGLGVLLSSLTKFAISRKREYMADAGAAEMTRRPLALAMALRKISGNPDIAQVKRDDVAQLFIHYGGGNGRSELGLRKKGHRFSLFSTHPPIEQRIQILEQF